MYIVTFYSYRGGVGRTTALVNVGFELARRGRKVLLVDFDLESPDLTSFPPLAPSEPRKCKGGIVEYVAAYCEKGESPDVTEYLYPVKGQKDRLWVMPAGCKDDEAPYWEADAYGEALAGIDWQGLYDRQDGYLFFEDTRAQWDHLKLDYVLIDAHAGVTPALGISTRQLANAVVLFHSRQDYGWLRVAGRIEEAERTFGKSIEHFVVNAGVVEEDDGVPLENNEFCISFSHRLLQERKVVVGYEAHSRLAKEYRRLTNALIAANFAKDPDSALLLLRKILTDPSTVSGRLDREPDYSSDLDQIINGFPNDAVILAQAACCLYAAARYGRALEVLGQAVELRPDSPELLWQRASYRRRLNVPGAVSDLLKLLDKHDPQKRNGSAASEEGCPKLLVFDSDSKTWIAKEGNVTLGPWGAIDWRFHLPEELRDEATAPISDYSDDLLYSPGIDPYVANAVWQLRQFSEEGYEEARRKPAVATLSPDAQAVLFAERHPDREQDDPHKLIRARKWAEAADLLAPRLRQPDNWPLEDALCLFIAWWGLGNEDEIQKCGKMATDQLTRRMTSDVSEFQMMALVYWKTGRREIADRMLDCIDEKVSQPESARVFSYWRLQRVSWKQFQEDSADMRQLFRGAKIPPPFLGKEPAYR